MPNQPPTLRFSTDMFPERERIAAWRELFRPGILKLDIEPMGGAFCSDATLRALPGLASLPEIKWECDTIVPGI